MMWAGWGYVRQLQNFLVHSTRVQASRYAVQWRPSRYKTLETEIKGKIQRYHGPWQDQIIPKRLLQTTPWLLSRGCGPCSRLERIMSSMGLNRCRIMKFRRSMMRFHYPWIAYSIPAAIVLTAGDMIAQYYCRINGKQMSLADFYCKFWNRERTLIYFLQGLLLVGPIISWWNLYWFRKLRCKKRLTFLLMKSLLDVFILAPILLSLMAFVYDQTKDHNVYNTDWEVTKKRIENRYYPAILEVLIFNLLTRPLFTLILCFVIPAPFRRPLRALYEIIFAGFLSNSFAQNCLREPPPRPPPPPPPVPSKSGTKKMSKKNFWVWPC